MNELDLKNLPLPYPLVWENPLIRSTCDPDTASAKIADVVSASPSLLMQTADAAVVHISVKNEMSVVGVLGY